MTRTTSTTSKARTTPCGTSTGTLRVWHGPRLAGTCYPLRLPGRTPGVVAWVAYAGPGLYVGHERSRAAAVRAIVAAGLAR